MGLVVEEVLQHMAKDVGALRRVDHGREAEFLVDGRRIQRSRELDDDGVRALTLGAQLIEGIDAPTVCRSLLDRGLICNAVNASTLRFAPPLTVSEAELSEAAALVRTALSEVTA